MRVLVLPRRVGGEANDPLRRSCRRREAEAPARAASTSSTPVSGLRRGGKLLADQLAVHGTELAFCVPGESYLALLDGLYELADPADHLPPRGGRRQHGGGVRQAHRPARRLHGHARARRDPGGGRRAHRVPGLDADDPARRTGRRRAQEEREAFQEVDYRADVRAACASGWRRSTASSASPSSSPARSRPPAPAVPGPVVLALPEDMLAASSDVADAPPFQRRPAQPGSGGPRVARASCSRRPSGRSRSSAARAGRRATPTTCARSSRRNSLPTGAAFRRQDSLDNDSPVLRRRRRHRHQPGARRARARGRRAARRRRRGSAR